MNMIEKFIESSKAGYELAKSEGATMAASKFYNAYTMAEAFLVAENTVQCKNRNCRKPVVNDKPLGRKKEYCDNKCRMAERSNRVKNKEVK